jgi:hypothetical protein
LVVSQTRGWSWIRSFHSTAGAPGRPGPFISSWAIVASFAGIPSQLGKLAISS